MSLIAGRKRKQVIHSNSEGDIYIEEMPLLLVHLREEEKGADARLSEVLSYALDGYVYETATEISTFEGAWRRHRIEKIQFRDVSCLPCRLAHLVSTWSFTA